MEEKGEATVPLIVKTNQLAGPITSGRNAFFYDGVRVPFIRIADSFYRILLGVCVGAAIVCESPSTKSYCFSGLAAVSLIFAIYVGFTAPYSRTYENCLSSAMLAVIGIAAFFLSSCLKRDLAVASSMALSLLVGISVVIGLYSAIVVFATGSAILCPPLEEARFLEKLANCSVTISDQIKGWVVEAPAYSKYSVKDLQAQSTSGCVNVTKFGSAEEVELQFTAREMRDAFKTGVLPIP